MMNLFPSIYTGRYTVFLLALSALAPLADANLVRNGAFNEPGAVTSPQPPITRPDNRIPSWGMRAEWYVDTSVKPPFEGAQVIRAEGGTEGRQLFQQVYLEPGKKYTLSAWVKTKGLTKTSSKLGDSQTGILVTDSRWTQKFAIGLHNDDFSDWRRTHITFTAPDALVVGGVAQPCLVRVFLPKGEKGTLWVSGLQIEEGDEPGEFEFVTSLQRYEAATNLQKLSESLGVVERQLQGFEGASKQEMLSNISALHASAGDLRKQLDSSEKAGATGWTQVEKKLDSFNQKAKQYLEPFAWWSNPWSNLPLRGLPPEVTKTGEREVQIVRAVNDYGALLLPIANLTDQTIPVEVKVGDEVAPFSTQSTFAGPIKVSTSYWVSNEGYVSTLSPVKEHRSFPYFLQALPSSNTTLLPSNETTQLWFDVDTKGMQPGTYRYRVALIGLNKDFTWEGSIVLKVLPVTLPEKVPANVMAYFTMPLNMEPFKPHSAEKPILNFTAEERLEMARPWLNIWKEMGFNRLLLSNQFLKYEFDKEGRLSAPVDYRAFDAYHDLWKEVTDEYWAGYQMAGYHIYKDYRNLSKAKFDEVERKRTESVLKSFIEHSESVGITSDKMVICLFDEPHGKRIDVTRQGLEALKKVAPGWRTMAGISGTDRSHVEPLMPLLDIFVVRQRMGQMDMKPETIKHLKESGKEVWGYSCSGSFEYLHPYRYFRLLPWQAWSNGLSGYALYSTILHEAYPKMSARSSFFSPLFLGQDGPVMGRGARGFQCGSKDWSIFAMAKAELEKRKSGPNTAKLESLLSKSLNTVVAEEDDGALADEVREQLLMEIQRLQSL